MTTITIAYLATAPQIDSRRVARDLIEWLADRGWVIVRGQIELPFGRDPHPPAPLPSTVVYEDVPMSSVITIRDFAVWPRPVLCDQAPTPDPCKSV